MRRFESARRLLPLNHSFPTGSLLKFFTLTFAVTWAFYLLALSVSADPAPDGPTPLVYFLVFVGTFAPSMIALWLTQRSGGRASVLALITRLFKWQVKGRWYVFAITYALAIKLTVVLLHRAATGSWPTFGSEAWYIIVAATVFSTIVGGQAGEEIGWRGYALPRLAARMGLGRASLLLGVIWAGWHLPLFFLPGADSYGQSIWVYLMAITPLSVAMAWLYAKTNGSLLLTMLMHSAVNQTAGIVPSTVRGANSVFAWNASLVATLTLPVLWITAGYFLLRMRRVDLPVLLNGQ